MSRDTQWMHVGLRVDRLPGVGPRYEVATIDGHRLTVVIDPQGDRHISLRSGTHVEAPETSVVISARQSTLLALILSDAQEIAEAAYSPNPGLAPQALTARSRCLRRFPS